MDKSNEFIPAKEIQHIDDLNQPRPSSDSIFQMIDNFYINLMKTTLKPPVIKYVKFQECTVPGCSPHSVGETFSLSEACDWVDEWPEKRFIESQRMEPEEFDKTKHLEQVNHPKHYQSESGLEAIDVIEAFSLNFNLGNVLKYILREGLKGKTEDLKKALWYLQREIQNREETENDPKV